MLTQPFSLNTITMLVNLAVLLEQETELIQSCVNGDRHSQSDLYDLFAPKMFAVCLRYSKNREEAEEILQEGFVQVFKSLKSFRHAGSFEGWIRKIMVYCCVKNFRSKTNMHPVVNIESVNVEDIFNNSFFPNRAKMSLLLMSSTFTDSIFTTGCIFVLLLKFFTQQYTIIFLIHPSNEPACLKLFKDLNT